jgi:hypothetical protein
MSYSHRRHRSGRPSSFAQRTTARPHRQPVVASSPERSRYHVARHHAAAFLLHCAETFTVECVVLAFLHLTPAAVAAVVFMR